MPFEIMDIQQVARYLHLDQRVVGRLAQRGKLPCRKRSGRLIFQKAEIDHWVELRLHELSDGRLAQIEAGVRRHHGMDEPEHDAVICEMIPRGGVVAPLHGRTARGVVEDLLDLADAAGLVFAREELLSAILQREQLCSTAFLPYTALPHPRHPTPYDIAESFIVAGLSPQGVPFAAGDGSLTRLFFLICCKDDRTHLHVLARLGRMLSRREVIGDLLAAGDADGLLDVLRRAEREAISCPVDR